MRSVSSELSVEKNDDLKKQEKEEKKALKKKKRSETWRKIKGNKLIYLMITPGVLYLFIYKYIPMYGLVISFQDYKPYRGISGSEWVGFEHFERLFTSPDFWMILKNTLVLFSLQLFITFPIPIILALMLNEV